MSSGVLSLLHNYTNAAVAYQCIYLYHYLYYHDSIDYRDMLLYYHDDG